MNSSVSSIFWNLRPFAFRLLILIVLPGLPLLCSAQDQSINALRDSSTTVVDSTQIDSQTDSLLKAHNPTRAAIYSAVIPGLGQVYNKKYWKAPIPYVGFGIAIYFLENNLKNLKYYRQSYLYANDGDPTTINESGYSNSSLLKAITLYKKWRDLSYISLGAIYVLNIVDAYVDAHLFYFDISEDISMHIAPFVPLAGKASVGLTLSLKL